MPKLLAMGRPQRPLLDVVFGPVLSLRLTVCNSPALIVETTALGEQYTDEKIDRRWIPRVDRKSPANREQEEAAHEVQQLTEPGYLRMGV